MAACFLASGVKTINKKLVTLADFCHHGLDIVTFFGSLLLHSLAHFSRMCSKGSRFTLGLWGLRVCSPLFASVGKLQK